MKLKLFSLTLILACFGIFQFVNAASVTVRTNTPTDVKQNTVTLNGIISFEAPGYSGSSGPYNFPASRGQYRFAYSSNPSFLNPTYTDYQIAQGGVAQVRAFATVTGLSAATAYYARLEFMAPDGFITLGELISFVTLGQQGTTPVAATLQASRKASDGVIFNGSVDTSGKMAVYWFEYADNAALAWSTATPARGLSNVVGYVQVSERVSGLSARTYYYRLGVQSEAGTTYGDVLPLPISPAFSSPYQGEARRGFPPLVEGRLGGEKIQSIHTARAAEPAPPLVEGRVGRGAILPLSKGKYEGVQKANDCVSILQSWDTYNILPGQEFAVSVKVKNNCPATLTDGQFKLPLPAGIEVVSGNIPYFMTTDTTAVWKFGEFISGGTAEGAFRLRADAKVPASVLVLYASFSYEFPKGVMNVSANETTGFVHATEAGGLAFVGSMLESFFFSQMLWVAVVLAIGFFLLYRIIFRLVPAAHKRFTRKGSHHGSALTHLKIVD